MAAAATAARSVLFTRRRVAPALALDARLGAGGESADPFRLDLDDHASLARAEIRILVLAQILLRKRVDVVEPLAWPGSSKQCDLRTSDPTGAR
jgi:hypothetical protein